MTEETILSELTEIFRNVFENQKIEINQSTSAKEIHNWDSMNHIILINEIEKHFGVEFDLDDLIAINDVGDILQALQSKI